MLDLACRFLLIAAPAALESVSNATNLDRGSGEFLTEPTLLALAGLSLLGIGFLARLLQAKR
jgi:hypothetical protein